MSKTALSTKTKSSKPKKAVVGIFDLQVILAKEDGHWIAQAIQIDYAAAGPSATEAKKNFEVGLFYTITEHLKMFGSLDKLFQAAPPSDWLDLYKKKQPIKEYSQVSIHEFIPEGSKLEYGLFPFQGIQFVELDA